MKKKSLSNVQTVFTTGAALAALPMLGNAAAAPAQSAWVNWDKPKWLAEVSLNVKESYDDNLYLVNGTGAMRKQSAWATTVSPKVGFNFAPLLDKDLGVQSLTLSYTPDFAIYHGADEESYKAHRFGNLIKGKSGDFSYSFDNAFLYNDGSDIAPIYLAPDNARSAYATAFPRERREQIQDRAKISLQYDFESFFVRPTASLLYYDLRTVQRATAGYQNYADRYDVNGGLDVGYKINKQMAVTLGYRYGHQRHEQLAFPVGNLLSSPSDYQRILVGFEGKPWNWLTANIQFGPDFRAYEHDSATHITPVTKKHPVLPYGEANIAAQITANDTLTFKYRMWQWVSSTGQVPYLDSSYDLAYKHKFSSKLSLDVGGKIGSSDYTRANTASGKRIDYMYTASIGIGYAFNANLSANIAYTADLGRNMHDNIANDQFREFDRNLVSLGLQWKF